MGFERKFSVALTSGALNLKGVLVAYKRDPETFMMSRKEIPSVSYEVDVEEFLPQFGLSSGNVCKDAQYKHHLSPGKDGKMYLCCTPLLDEELVPIIKLWLAHQVLVELFGLDIVAIKWDLSGDGSFYQEAKAFEVTDFSSTEKRANFVLRVCNAKLQILELKED